MIDHTDLTQTLRYTHPALGHRSLPENASPAAAFAYVRLLLRVFTCPGRPSDTAYYGAKKLTKNASPAVAFACGRLLLRVFTCPGRPWDTAIYGPKKLTKNVSRCSVFS